MAVGPRLTESPKSLSIIGGYFVFAGLISFYFKEVLYLSDAVPSCITGIIFGPLVANVLNPFEWFGNDREIFLEFTMQLARLIIGLQVLFTGCNLPKQYIRKEWLSLFVLLLPVMTCGWLGTGLLIWGIVPGLTYLEALVISACVTPTDPVLANSICKGRFAETFVPLNVRGLILSESGANDGLGLPYLMMAIYLVRRAEPDYSSDLGVTVGKWIYEVLLYQVMMGAVMGVIIGYAARKGLRYAHDRSLIDHESFLAYGIAVALFILGVVYMAGASDLLACFLAGCVLNWDGWYQEECAGQAFAETVDMYMDTLIFMYIGAIMPFDYWHASDNVLDGWRLVVLGLAVLFLRRLPFVFAFSTVMPALKDWKEAVFAGYFGPIGVAALFWTSEALHQLPHNGSREHLREVLLPIVYFLIVFSILVHGTTISIYQGTRSLLGKGHPKPTDDDPIPIRPGADLYIARAQSRASRGDLSLSRTSTRRQPAREYLSRHISIPSSGPARPDEYRSQFDLALERSSTRRQSARDFLSPTISIDPDLVSPRTLSRNGDVDQDAETDDKNDSARGIPLSSVRRRKSSVDEEVNPGASSPPVGGRSAQSEWIRKGRMARGEVVDDDTRSRRSLDPSDRV